MVLRNIAGTSAAEMEAIARATLDGLPRHFSEHLGDILLQIEDYADDETLAAVGLIPNFEDCDSTWVAKLILG